MRPPKPATRLDRRLVRYRSNALWLVVLGADRPRLSWHSGLSLEVEVLAGLLRLALLGRVVLDTDDELLSRARVTDVLDADVDALLDVAVADLSVEDDADSGLGDVVDNAGLAVVDLVWLWDVLVDVSARRCSSGSRILKLRMLLEVVLTMPFWTAPLATTSTMSPTRYCLR